MRAAHPIKPVNFKCTPPHPAALPEPRRNPASGDPTPALILKDIRLKWIQRVEMLAWKVNEEGVE
jgi:hypothetical protein